MTATNANLATPSDAQLVARMRRGKVAAFEVLVDRYQGLVCAVAFSGTGSQALSEEVAQETFLVAWRDRKQLQDPNKLRSWLCGIARNQAHAARRRSAKEAIALELVDVDIPTTDPLADDVLSKAQDEALVWRALETMPVLYREPLVLFYREEQSVREVALGLGLREVTVKKRLSRGREFLKGRVTTLVERTLTNSKPRKAFVAGVVALLASRVGTASALATRATGGLTASAGIANVAVVTIVGAGFIGALVVGMSLTGADESVTYSGDSHSVLSSASRVQARALRASEPHGNVKQKLAVVRRAVAGTTHQATATPRRFVAPRPRPALRPLPATAPALNVVPTPAVIATTPTPPVNKIVVRAHITRAQRVGSSVRIRFNRGRTAGVAKGWRGSLLEGNTDVVLDEFIVYRVRQRYSLARVKLSMKEVTANSYVSLSPR